MELAKNWGIYILWRERNIHINHPSQRGTRNYVGFEQALIFLIRKKPFSTLILLELQARVNTLFYLFY